MDEVLSRADGADGAEQFWEELCSMWEHGRGGLASTRRTLIYARRNADWVEMCRQGSLIGSVGIVSPRPVLPSR